MFGTEHYKWNFIVKNRISEPYNIWVKIFDLSVSSRNLKEGLIVQSFVHSIGKTLSQRGCICHYSFYGFCIKWSLLVRGVNRYNWFTFVVQFYKRTQKPYDESMRHQLYRFLKSKSPCIRFTFMNLYLAIQKLVFSWLLTNDLL